MVLAFEFCAGDGGVIVVVVGGHFCQCGTCGVVAVHAIFEIGGGRVGETEGGEGAEEEKGFELHSEGGGVGDLGGFGEMVCVC